MAMDKKEAGELVSDGNVQASALLTIGPIIWKWISNVSNVDFLLSINGEKFNMTLNFFLGHGWFILALIGALWLLSTIGFRSYTTRAASPNIAILISAIIVAFLFGVLFAVESTGGVPNVLAGWGSQDPRICNSSIDTKRLVSFRKDYKLAVVCGVQDMSKDRLEDEIITISSRFTIIGGLQPIATPVSFKMAQHMEDLSKQAQKAAGRPDQIVAVAIPTWYTAILLPNDVPVSKIAKLQDVMTLGGKIIDPQYFN